jgi:2-polyprenyl-6-hydroxyphenyl methylase / 3-demethylubiquinone-9 3-methyltransferase
MPVDNTIYDRLADQWWSDDGLLSILRTGFNPVRMGFMRRVIVDDHGIDPAGMAVLDVGCGGGLLAEEFARLGCRVTGIDPSEGSIGAARQHAARSGLQIDYQVAVGENLPVPDASIDIAYCCDVLEHVDDLDRVIAEAARVLRPGGLYLFDTINRTVRSWLVAIKLFQEWESTRFMEPNLHAWSAFIKPQELTRILRRHGLQEREYVGLASSLNPIQAIRLMRRRARGEVGFAEFAKTMAMKESRDQSVSYAGYAVKAGVPTL